MDRRSIVAWTFAQDLLARKFSPKRGREAKLSISVAALLVTACVGPFVSEIDLDASTVSQLRAEVSTTTSNQLAGREYESIGAVTATSCFNNFVTDEMSSTEHAMDQLRYKAAALGANALLNPRCEKEGTSLIKNCWTSTTCTASAVRVATADSGPDEVIASSGTCFVVSPEGRILTNAHVVDGATGVVVSLSDSRKFPAQIVGMSRSTDIAVLAIEASELSYLSLAPAASAVIGSEVFTVGFPVQEILGAEPKFTDGAVSSLSGLGGESTLMQITVPVQPGNSGGPLVRNDGSVIGIVTSTAAVGAFYRETGSLPQNINWAVKADYARPMFNAPPARPPTKNREAAVSRTIDAICRVEAVR
jgi:S1-C subfamily serine protease